MHLPARLLAAAVLAAAAASTASAAPDVALAARLHRAAPTLASLPLSAALDALACAQSRGVAPEAQRLAIIDYTLPSTAQRMWVFDLRQPRLLFVEHVAHGRRSGNDRTTAFSNVPGSEQTSLGLFVTGEAYHGHNGYSLRLDGLQPGINDHARERAIVMHGAAYVNPAVARRQGRLGRSLGCPAVRPIAARPLIDALKDGQLLFAYGPVPGAFTAISGCTSGALVAHPAADAHRSAVARAASARSSAASSP